MMRPQPFGRYELLQRISAGGMAEVFRAIHLPSNTQVALKRILPEVAADEEFIEMFGDEARIVSQLEHPYIARCLDFGEVGGGFYIAFEYVDGKDLRVLFDRCARSGSMPPLWFTVHVFAQIAEGLAYAHTRRDARGEAASIVHRDVSPQNIVVSFQGDVKLIDFGIAKAAGKLSRTQVGSIKGKFGYMSPEQVSGREVDPRTDVFSLGICLWELLTGRRLFHADNELLVMEKVRTLAVEPPSASNPACPPELDRIVLKALAKDRDRRYRAAKDIYQDLNRFASGRADLASRERIAQYMRRSFPEASASTGGMVGARQVPEMGNMATNDKSGSDLDIFAGLGKRVESSRPPSPPSRATLPPPPPSRVNLPNTKHTLHGVGTLAGLSPFQSPGAAASPPTPRGSAPPPPPPIAQRTPPPPPGRGSLPPIAAPPHRTTRSPLPSAPNAAAAAPNPSGAHDAAHAPKAAAVAGAMVAMDWDDDDEATHIFGKGEVGLAARGAPSPAAGNPAPSGPMLPMAKPTLLGASGPLHPGQQPPPPSLTSSVPPPQVRAAPSSPAFPSALSASSAAPVPLPALLGQTILGVAPGRPPSVSPPPSIQPVPAPAPTQQGLGAAPIPTSPPPAMAPWPAASTGGTAAPAPLPLPHASPLTLPIPSSDYLAQAAMPRSMEATALVRPPPSRALGMWVALGVGASALITVGAILLMPHAGRLTVQVSDRAGKSLNRVEIFVDGRKQCDTAPCIVAQVNAGQHEVKVLADGYEAPPIQSVNVESRGQATATFAMEPSGGSLKVGGSQAGVELYVDGRELGPLPQELHNLTPGEHLIKVAGSERYQPLEQRVTVGQGKLEDLGPVTLKVLRGKATISLQTPGARVYLTSGADRRELPMLPISVDIDTTKSWSLQAMKPGYEDYDQPIAFDDGQAEKTYAVRLQPKSAPFAPSAVAAPAPVHAPPRPQHPAQAAPEPAAEPSGGEAFLNINSIPPSTCYLDGRSLGITPKVHVEVKPGAHTVKFVNTDQGLTKTVSVNVGAGETKPAVARLN